MSSLLGSIMNVLLPRGRWLLDVRRQDRVKLDAITRHHGFLHQGPEELLPPLVIQARQPPLGEATESQSAVLASALCLLLGEPCPRAGEVLLKVPLLRV